jgi:hypothetical protein
VPDDSSYMSDRDMWKVICVALGIGIVLGVAGLAIYQHVSARSSLLPVSVAAKSKASINANFVVCTTDGEGDYVAYGYLDSSQQSVFRVEAQFFDKEAVVGVGYTYFDNTDPAQQGSLGGLSFSVVVPEPLTTGTPTSCRISETANYGSTASP